MGSVVHSDPAPSSQPLLPPPQTAAARQFFGFRLRHIPEVILPSVTGQGVELAAVEELLQEQSSFLDALSRVAPDEGWSLQLRLGYGGEQPRAGEVLLFGSSQDRDGLEATHLASSIDQLLPRRFPWERLEPEVLDSLVHMGWEDGSGRVRAVRQRPQEVMKGLSINLPFRTQYRFLDQTLRALSASGHAGCVLFTLRPANLTREDRRQLQLGIARLRTEITDDPREAVRVARASDRPGGSLRDWVLQDALSRACITHLENLLARARGLFELVVHVALVGADPRRVGVVLGGELTAGEDSAWPRGVTPLYEFTVASMVSPVELGRLAPRRLSPRGGLAELTDGLVTPEDAAHVFRCPVAIRRHSFPPGFTVRNEPFPAPPRMPDGTRRIILGKVLDHGRRMDDDLAVSLDAFGQHGLVFGTSGSGKTRTLLQIVSSAWLEHRVPFLVIDPKPSTRGAYRQLLHSPVAQDLKVFTLGRDWPSRLAVIAATPFN